MQAAKVKVTVLMPVYNGEIYLKEAIDSILEQTFKDFEFLIINDGSTDNTVNIINSYSDKRIKLVNNEYNMGIIGTLNKGLEMAKGEYIVRMDADDISLPYRIEKQLKFMDANQDIGVCGSMVKNLGFFGVDFPDTMIKTFKPFLKTINVECDTEIIKSLFCFYCPIYHPTVIMRKSLFEKFNLKYRDYKYAEDYDLWVQAAKYFKVANLKEVLLYYRINNAPSRNEYRKIQAFSSAKIKLDLLCKLGIKVSIREILRIQKLYYQYDYVPNNAFIKKLEGYLLKVKSANDLNRYADPIQFQRAIEIVFSNACLKFTQNGVWCFSYFVKSPICKNIRYKHFSIFKYALLFLLGKIRACIKR